MGKSDVWRRDEVESPCVKICQIHPGERICVGCLRSIEEIGTWSLMSAEERRAVLADLPSRAGRVKRRRGGRRARTGAGQPVADQAGGGQSGIGQTGAGPTGAGQTDAEQASIGQTGAGTPPEDR